MGKRSFRLVDAPNTHNPALISLRQLGFEIGVYPASSDELGELEEIGHWWARKEDCEFVAGDPLALLGLVSIWQIRGDRWIREDDVDIFDKVLEEAFGPG